MPELVSMGITIHNAGIFKTLVMDGDECGVVGAAGMGLGGMS